jgi:hypothetical protein
MKKLRLFMLLAISVATVSCSKQNETATPEKSDKLYDVNLSVSTFSTEIVGLTSSVGSTRGAVSATNSTNAVGDQISYIEYAIYNSSGLLVKNATQVKSLATFGTINEQLPAGSYRIFILGSTDTYIISKDNYASVYVYFGNRIADSFMKTIDIKVAEEPLSQSVVLERVVGKLEVQITDAIPANTAKITISSSSGTAVYFNNSYERNPYAKSTETTLTSADYGKLNFISSSFIIPLNSGSIISDVSIRAYNTTGGLMVDKIVKDVKVETNKKTVMTGKLFTTPAATTTGFSIGLNSDWNTTTNNVSF